ncbi:MAG: hypothetical protein JO051_14000 [Acidobacteriaceae bacterium]|nr:hypothetical protein [Acidobacteriaceae bacterium]
MTLTIELPPDELDTLSAKALAAGLSVEECAGQILSQLLQQELPAPKPLAARIREIWSDLPAEEQTELPVDGASQHDHYIYGIPKRES